MDIRYTNDNFQFFLRVSALIFNEDESKVLLFNILGRDFYMLPGGKINQLEESVDAIKREISEELGWGNLDYKFLGVSEEFVTANNYDNHQLNLIYKTVYKGQINMEEFNGLESNEIKFKWIDVKEVNKYQIYPSIVSEMIKNSNGIFHSIENLINRFKV